MRSIRIGSGAGFAGDRIEPAVELAAKGDLDYLCFECLAERTIAQAQARRLNDPAGGYDRMLDQRMRAILPHAYSNGVRIVSNMGAANAEGAMHAIVRIARELGISGLKVAAVLGDDVLDQVRSRDFDFLDRAGGTQMLGDRLLSANAYLGAAPIAAALTRGADVVVTGRVADPALFVGPMMHAFGWRETDWDIVGRGTIIGHLLECAGQLTGGYFADPGVKDVAGLATLGFPLAEVFADGSAVLSKVDGSGGALSLASCKEQLLYEILDPAAYAQPDVLADLTSVRFDVVGSDRISVSGGGGRPRPDKLKVSVGYHNGFIGEGQISYAGPGARARGELALAIVRERLALTDVPIEEWRGDLIGHNAVSRGEAAVEPREVRVRAAGRTAHKSAAEQVGAEVEALYTNGPAGGGGATTSVREIVAVGSILIDRDLVRPSIVEIVS